MNEIDFTDKVAIITGASSGIGAETALAFAELKAKLTLVGRDQTRLTNIAEQCTAKHNQPPLCLLLDLTHENSCETVVNTTIEKYGKIDVLINCAGKIILSSLHDKSMAAFDEVMNINFRVPFYLSQLTLPHLKQTKGNIVNIGSSLAKRTKPGFLPYIVTKAAVAMLAKQTAEELALEGVRINTISPGMTRTNILSNLNFDASWQKLVYERMAPTLPSRKIIEPTEVARLVCIVASNVFPSLTGSEILMDGAACMV